MNSGRDPGCVLRAVWAALGRQDKAAALTFFSAGASWSLYIPQDVVPFGGVAQGRPAISDRLQTILEQFQPLRYLGTIHLIDGDTVHAQVAFCVRHRRTGESLDGIMRQVVTIEDGLIVDFKEYHDIERIRAYMCLISYLAREQI